MTMQRLLVVVILICLFSISCKEVKKSANTPAMSLGKKINLDIPRYPEGLFVNVNSIVEYLDNNEALEGRRIGYGSRESESYKVFVLLKKHAKDSTLLRLTLHSNPKLRVYGMWALTDRNKELALRQLYRFKRDNAVVQYFEYCTSMPESVSSLVLSHFDPQDLGINYSTREPIQEPY